MNSARVPLVMLNCDVWLRECVTSSSTTGTVQAGTSSTNSFYCEHTNQDASGDDRFAPPVRYDALSYSGSIVTAWLANCSTPGVPLFSGAGADAGRQAGRRAVDASMRLACHFVAEPAGPGRALAPVTLRDREPQVTARSANGDPGPTGLALGTSSATPLLLRTHARRGQRAGARRLARSGRDFASSFRAVRPMR